MKLFFVRFSTALDKVAPGGLSQFLRLTPQSIQGGNNGCENGIWAKVLSKLAQAKKGKLWSIDGSCIKVHKHGFGGAGGADSQLIGKTKGGWNTKVHALVDRCWEPS